MVLGDRQSGSPYAFNIPPVNLKVKGYEINAGIEGVVVIERFGS